MHAPLALLLYCHKWPCAAIIAAVTGLVTFLFGLYIGKRQSTKQMSS
jgi:hypothetical protein